MQTTFPASPTKTERAASGGRRPPDSRQHRGADAPRSPWLISFLDKLGHALDYLAQHPLRLFVVMVVLDALIVPYEGVRHDAHLYAAQVMNRVEHGRYDDDLYFRYGSQDRYSLFSAALAPLCAALGLFPSFFAVYLAGRALFLFGCLRLFRALIPDRRAAVLALLYVAMTAVPYGGLGTFHVNERFLTPRLLAAGLTLLALERMLAYRFVASGLLLLAGLALHPLIAFGGVLVYLLWCGVRFLSPKVILALAALGAVALVGVLMNGDLAARLFGVMDPEWRDLVLRRSPHCFPEGWDPLDWARVAFAFCVVVLAVEHLAKDQARFCVAVCAAGTLGVVGTWLAAELPYALFLQGQPFRVLWLTQLLAVPLGFFLAFRFAAGASPAGRTVALVFLYCVAVNLDLRQEAVLLPLAALPLCLLHFHGLRRVPREPAWLWYSAVHSLAFGLALSLAYRTFQITMFWPILAGTYEPLLLAKGLPAALNKAVLLGLAVAAAALTRWFVSTPRFAVAALVVALGYQAALFAVSRLEAYRVAHQVDYADVVFVKGVLAERHGTGDQLTVYWPTDINFVWFELHANSYFHLMQTPGNVFDRRTAVEGCHRALLVRDFEVQHLRALRSPPVLEREWQALMPNFYETGEWQEHLADWVAVETDPKPKGLLTREALLRLCADPGLDYVITCEDLGPGYVATNDSVYVYECRRLRDGER